MPTEPDGPREVTLSSEDGRAEVARRTAKSKVSATSRRQAVLAITTGNAHLVPADLRRDPVVRTAPEEFSGAPVTFVTPDNSSPLPPAVTPDRWRLVIEAHNPVAGPIKYDFCTTILDAEKATKAELASLRVAVEHLNAGITSCFTDRIDEFVPKLLACGVRVRVEETP